MKKAIALAAVASCGLLSSALAQTTIFSDNFVTDSSLSQPPWYNLNNTTAASYAFTSGTGLGLSVSAGTGKLDEMFAQFSSSPVTLSSGQYISLTVNFSGVSGMAADTGGLLVGLFNAGATATGNEQGSSGSTGTGGATAASQGYFGIMGYNTSAGTSTKFFSRTGGASDANELGYYSSQTAGSITQLGSAAATGNANLANNTPYTLVFTITDNGASGDAVNATISNGSSVLDNWTQTDATGLYNNFDQLDFGFYGKLGPVDGNITSESIVTTGVVNAPEPSTFALAGVGMGLVGFARYFRRRK